MASHHEQIHGNQKRFSKACNQLCWRLKKYSNAFTEELQDLVVLDSKDTLDSHVTEAISNIARIWEEQVQM